jgi:hypothetical protein
MFALRVPDAALLINTNAADRLMCRTIRWQAGRIPCNRKRSMV